MRLDIRDYESAISDLSRYRKLKIGEYRFAGTQKNAAAIVFGCEEVAGIDPRGEVDYVVTPHGVGPGPGIPGYFCLIVELPKYEHIINLAFDYTKQRGNVAGLSKCAFLFLLAAKLPGENEEYNLFSLFKQGGVMVELSSLRSSMQEVIKTMDMLCGAFYAMQEALKHENFSFGIN